MSTTEGRATSRDTNNLVENGTLPILRLAHFFLLNDEEDDEYDDENAKTKATKLLCSSAVHVCSSSIFIHQKATLITALVSTRLESTFSVE